MDITTPSLLFSAICMLLSAYNNMYLTLSRRIRDFVSEEKRQGKVDKDKLEQIKIFRLRLEYIKNMQFYAVLSLVFSTISIFCLLFTLETLGELMFVVGLISFLLSLYYSIRDILHLTDSLKMLKFLER